jgi:SPX domain protein involved in polyphosphate accumulation
MKKKVKKYAEQIDVGAQNRHNVLRDFSMLLDNQVNTLKDIFGLVVDLFKLKDNYLCYMRKKIKFFIFEEAKLVHSNCHQRELTFLALEFQIEMIVLFLLEQQGVLARRLSHIGHDHQKLIQQPDSSMISEIQEAYREVGRDLLRLLYFVEMNATGLRKILKKFDKRLRYKFTDYYVKTRANHPYSQLRQVLRHVVMFLNP